jgi:iron complex transport system substrate-binding protein
VLAGALGLAGCGTTDVDTEAAGASAVPVSEECAADTTATTTDPVSLTDGLGRTVELDQPAQRVAILEWQQIEDALTLCVAPVAVSDAEGFGTWVSAETLPEEGVTDIGSREEPDLDALYAADPDLIIIDTFDPEDELLTRLEERDVPVLATPGIDPEDPIGHMLDVFTMIGDATGRAERAEAVVTEFEDTLAAGKEKVADVDLETTDFLFFDGWVARARSSRSWARSWGSPRRGPMRSTTPTATAASTPPTDWRRRMSRASPEWATRTSSTPTTTVPAATSRPSSRTRSGRTCRPSRRDAPTPSRPASGVPAARAPRLMPSTPTSTS